MLDKDKWMRLSETQRYTYNKYKKWMKDVTTEFEI